MKTLFFGGFDVGRSTNLADCQLMNLYPEVVENQDGKAVGAFYQAPGLRLLATAGNGPIRGMQAVPFLPSGLLVVSGADVYVFATNFTGGKIGSLLTTSGPVSISSNGLQSAIFDGVAGYAVNGLLLSNITLPANGPVSSTSQDGFVLVNQAGTRNVWQSNLDDVTTWDPLNFSAADATGDPIVAVADVHRQVWLIKSFTTEVWIDAGLPGFAFERIDGVFPEYGCVAPATVRKLGERLAWLGQNDQGQGIVVATDGYTPVRISNHAIEHLIAGFAKTSTISDAIAFSYQQEGHLFYQLTFPTADATLVYDAAASELMRRPMWHQRGEFINGQFHRHWANCAASFAGLNVVGDYRNGNIYAYDLDTQTDNGTQRKFLRTWRALKDPSPTPIRFPGLQLDLQTGFVPDGTNPQLMLRFSDDGGHNWSDPRNVSAGATGQTAKRVKFNRLGATKRNGGLDRIFELSWTDQFSTALIGADFVETE